MADLFNVGDRVRIRDHADCGYQSGPQRGEIHPIFEDDGPEDEPRWKVGDSGTSRWQWFYTHELEAADVPADPQPEGRSAQYHLGFADGYRSGEGCADYRAGFLAGYAQASADD